jgi:hypothetical protein
VDFGVEITKQLSEILDTQPLVSTRGWKVFYSLEAYSQKLKERISEDRWKSLQQAVSTNPFSYVRENLFNSLQIVNGEAGIVEEVIPRSGGPRQSILVTGWALAPDTRMPVKKLMVVHEGKTSQIFISQQEPRMDTVRKFGNHALRSQWNFVLDTRAWGPGEHTFEIYAMLEGDRLGRLGGCEKKCRINLSSE